jgi:rhodanese-related sulfurtransferase
MRRISAGAAAVPLRLSIDELLAASQARLQRVEAADLAAVAATDDALVVDIRPVAQRQRDGELPFGIVIDRNVLEWRLDPASDWCIPETGYDRHIVLVCDEGYSSSLAAVTLQDLGERRATDLAGGYQAWLAHVAAHS